MGIEPDEPMGLLPATDQLAIILSACTRDELLGEAAWRRACVSFALATLMKKAASKSTPSDKKAQAKRAKQLDEWQKKHPKTSKSAAQHLHKPS